MSTFDQPLVSVVIPTYNHAHFLGRALQSVIDQTHTNWEVVLVDNHSQDHTDEVVKSFGDPRVFLHKIHNDGVIAASRNLGIRASRGEWIALLDSDDFWYPNRLEIALQGIQEDLSTDVCCTDEMQVDEATGNRKLLKFGPYCIDFYKKLLISGNCLSPSSTLIKRAFLIDRKLQFRENVEFVTAEDYDFWMLLAQAGAAFKFVHSVQGEYLIHTTNNSGRTERHNQAVQSVLKDHVYNLQKFEADKNQLWRNINSRLFLANAKNCFVKGNVLGTIRNTLFAFRNSFPCSLRHILSKTFG